ncbi:MAG TPA: hypothetical protein VGG08_11675 [Solirubrobacteraceae bacterium]|jgi:hypothetical protein
MADYPELNDDVPEREPDADFERGEDPGYALEQRHREERRAVEEAGGGESEGFELAEEELIEHTSHGDQHAPARIMRDASGESEQDDASYGEADSGRLND